MLFLLGVEIIPELLVFAKTCRGASHGDGDVILCPWEVGVCVCVCVSVCWQRDNMRQRPKAGSNRDGSRWK